MGESCHTVVARLRARSGMEELLRRELRLLVPRVRTEEGCVRYDLHRSSDDPSVFLFYEIWSCRDAWEKHMDGHLLRSFAEAATGLLAGPIDITSWTLIE